MPRARYAALMERLHGFHAGLAPGSPEVAVLAADLAALGASPGPPCAFRPELVDAAVQAGVDYVMAGSTLGGRMIARAAHRFAPADGYWRWCAVEGPERWRRALAAVEQCGDTARMEAAAVATFTAFEDWLGEAGHGA